MDCKSKKKCVTFNDTVVYHMLDDYLESRMDINMLNKLRFKYRISMFEKIFVRSKRFQLYKYNNYTVCENTNNL